MLCPPVENQSPIPCLQAGRHDLLKLKIPQIMDLAGFTVLSIKTY
jgi:hypothetical protein